VAFAAASPMRSPEAGRHHNHSNAHRRDCPGQSWCMLRLTILGRRDRNDSQYRYRPRGGSTQWCSRYVRLECLASACREQASQSQRMTFMGLLTLAYQFLTVLTTGKVMLF
jgi:hypothetical protein